MPGIRPIASAPRVKRFASSVRKASDPDFTHKQV
jgi:hypothetical protein